MSSAISAIVFIVFTALLVLGALTTTLRSLHYRRRGLPQPVLLPRDRDLLIGLAFPFVLIAAVRAFSLQPFVNAADQTPQLWWALLTGVPPVYAMARFVWFELVVIERPRLPGDEA